MSYPFNPMSYKYWIYQTTWPHQENQIYYHSVYGYLINLHGWNTTPTKKLSLHAKLKITITQSYTTTKLDSNSSTFNTKLLHFPFTCSYNHPYNNNQHNPFPYFSYFSPPYFISLGVHKTIPRIFTNTSVFNTSATFYL